MRFEESPWQTVNLSNLYEVRYGKANPGDGGNIPVVGSSGIYATTATSLVSVPTVVIGRKGNAGQAWFMNQPCFPSDTTFYLKPRQGNGYLANFVYFFLKYH